MELHNADCLEALRSMPDNSVDALVTDPPAGISFMAKSWDTYKARAEFIAFITEVMEECRRVLKPGAHALVWAIPRTSHWTATAVEDAGFEIRDVVTHHFGSGFPKSLNVGKAIDRRRWGDVRPVCRFLRQAIDASPHSVQDIAGWFGFHSRMVEHWAARDSDSQPSVPTWPQWLRLKELLGFSNDMDAKVWRLSGNDGAEREVVGTRSHGNPVAWYSQTPGPPGIANVTAPATPEAQQWDGFGTSLKPASEHWILARAPLSEKTVAANVLKWGTGALNVDGCRIGSQAGWAYPNGAGGNTFHGQDRRSDPEVSTKGRWPANLVLSHSLFCTDDGCDEACPVRMLDEQSGVSKSSGVGRHRRGRTIGNGQTHGRFISQQDIVDGFSDSGGASRFFYVAKPSKAERNRGLEGMPERPAHKFDGGPKLNQWTGKLETEAPPQANHHPTVKAVKLMAYLCRLITPPEGTVLDPFMGSGSTGLACQQEGFGFIGIEKDEEYYRIASQRLGYPEEHVPPHGGSLRLPTP